MCCAALDQAAWIANRPLSSSSVYGSVIAKRIVDAVVPSVFVSSPTTVRITCGLPAAVNVCVTVAPVCGSPSPKSHV